MRWALCICALACAACGRQAKDDEEAGGPGKPAVVDVKLDSLIAGQVEDALTATGRTDVLRKETVASPVAGKVLSIKVTEGASVKPGQVVATVRTKESESALEGAEGLLREAQGDAARREAQHAVDLAKATQTALALRAKLAGVVANRLVQEGEQVTENESLLTVLDLSSLDFQAEVPLSGIGRVKVGQPAMVTLQALPGEGLAARVAAILPQVQSTSQTLSIRLQFTREADLSRHLLKSDMAGDARIVFARRENALLAPKQAVLRSDEEGTYSIVTVGLDSVAHVVKVKPGAAQGERQEISGEGLVPGMKVVVQGQYGLADSTKVRPQP